MADGARQDILGQKALAAQRAFEARGMSLPKALRRALSRSADVLWDLALVTQSVTVEMLDQDGVIGILGQGDLLLLLDGPDGAVGLAAIDRQVMTGLVEVQTIQQVTQMPLDDDRVPTQTDAAMMAPLLDGTLARLADNLADHPLHPQLEGYRFGAMVEDSRTASLLLDDASYRAFRAEVDLALGRRRGKLSIILPERKARRQRKAEGDGDGPGPHEELLSRVPARLDAVLARLRIPLSTARNLKPGDSLPLAPDALERVEVVAGKGQVVARGKLGRMNGLRAVRLTWPVVAAHGGAADASAQRFAPGAETVAATDDGPAELPALPTAAPEMEEDLPDLPPLDFGAEAADFDFGDPGEDAAAFDGGDVMEPLPEIDMSDSFDAASMEFEPED